MSDSGIQVTYSQAFDSLVEVLSGVRRPGDFYATGVAETPMPTYASTATAAVPPGGRRRVRPTDELLIPGGG